MTCTAFAHHLPGLLQQLLLILAQPPFGRADQIVNGRIAGAHLLQHLLGRDPPVHHPDPLGLAIELFDLLQKAPQRGLVRGVAGHHLVGQGKTLRRDHQRDDHLHAIRALVPAVAIAALVSFGKGRIALKIGAGQIVEQHLELHPKEILPALPQVLEQSRRDAPAACPGSDTDCPSAPRRNPHPTNRPSRCS